MGVQFPRQKTRHWPFSIIYRLDRWLPLPVRWKLDLYLDLEAIAFRMAVENSFRVYSRESHPCQPDTYITKYIESHHRVLDLGCGDGSLTNIVAAKASAAVGIDHDKGRIEHASRTYPGITFVCADAFDYLKTAPKFDALFLSHVLEHLDGAESFLSNISQHFDLIYIEVPDFEGTPLNKLRLARERRLIYTDSDHVAEYDRAELKDLIFAAGLSIIEENYVGGVMRFWVRSRKI